MWWDRGIFLIPRVKLCAYVTICVQMSTFVIMGPKLLLDSQVTGNNGVLLSSLLKVPLHPPISVLFLLSS